MTRHADQALTVAQMRAAEQALMDAGISVDELMQRAGRGAAEWIWRLTGGARTTILCGPGNNGGDGYVIAEAIRDFGGNVVVVEAYEPRTDAASKAKALYGGEVLGVDGDLEGEVFVDCLYGSGLSRPLADRDVECLRQLAANHRHSVAVDVPSGIACDSGQALNEGLPSYEMTLALGAWKYAHFLMPVCAEMGALRLVDIGVEAVSGAARLLGSPSFTPPAADAHKYRRGLAAVIGGTMPGAALLACRAAQHGGAGYVKLLGAKNAQAPADIVVSNQELLETLRDGRLNAVAIGPGLGRDDAAYSQLKMVLAADVATVLDADALMLLTPDILQGRKQPVVATPHSGELAALERAFGMAGTGSKVERVTALAAASGMFIVAKGPDTVIASPDGAVVFTPRATPWLSVAGTGDVLAGTLASRLANLAQASEPLDCLRAICEAAWLHSEAARLTSPPFTASELAQGIGTAFASRIRSGH